jgi:hypothetical protein
VPGPDDRFGSARTDQLQSGFPKHNGIVDHVVSGAKHDPGLGVSFGHGSVDFGVGRAAGIPRTGVNRDWGSL